MMTMPKKNKNYEHDEHDARDEIFSNEKTDPNSEHDEHDEHDKVKQNIRKTIQSRREPFFKKENYLKLWH